MKAGVIPSQTGGGASRDHVILRVGEELAAALEAPECGRPLALGTVIDEALAKKDLIPLKEYLGAQQSVYKKRWLPSAWDVVDWSLRQIGVVGGTSKAARGEFVVLGNLEVSCGQSLFKEFQSDIQHRQSQSPSRSPSPLLRPTTSRASSHKRCSSPWPRPPPEYRISARRTSPH